MLHSALSTIPPDTHSTAFYRTVGEVKRFIRGHTLFRPRFSHWCIGITADPAATLRVRQKKGLLKHWQVWEVGNQVAWSLQNYFRGRNMQTCDTPEAGDAAIRYIYLYKSISFFGAMTRRMQW